MQLVRFAGFNRIYAVDTFKKEYAKLFGKSHVQYKRYYEKLETNLGILDDLYLDALEMQQFEPIVNEDGLYAIRHVSQINPRVIFTTITDEGKIVLLTCAKEKSTNDYSKALRKARELRTEILDELHKEEVSL